ncbi:hypothetical protein IE53DRAFT_248743 [Violaceomyces palustris]|uniref:Uncharacterized protein n=1 Tax=Violaceomyces palustris TaxID=1673888 RepID=A0ACD0NNU2_9BASI|nr:hypothetical protein IE53DRAFT_248743 [Violaceomyces palustris]
MRLKMRFLPLLLASLTLSAYPAFSQSDGLATFTLPPEEGSLPAIPTSSSSSDGGSTPTGPGTIPPIITTPPSISDPFENGSSSSSDGSSSSSSSSNSTDSLSTSSSANVTATSTSSAATSTGTLLPDDGANFTDPSGDWGYSGEFVQPFIPPELEADGDLVELAYLASTDPSLCEAQASSLSSRKRQLIERALGYDDDEEERGARRLKKRALVDLCLPNEATIAVTFHWMVPSYRTINDYVNSTALDLQIEKMRRKFAPFRIKFNVQQRWIHSGSVAVNQYSLYDSAEAAANSATTIRLKNKVKGLASNYNPTAYDHLNIFLIDSYYKDGEFPNGFCTYPGKGKIKNEADGCAVLVNTLPGHKDYAYRSSKPPSNLAAEWQGSTMVHEIGHWLDLKHLFDDDKGCAGDDGLAATPQYPTGSSVSATGIEPSLPFHFLSFAHLLSLALHPSLHSL